MGSGQSTDGSSSGSDPVGSGNYRVRQGECIKSIAFRRGFYWKTIWEDANNQELQEIRKNPNVLLPGDRVFIREKILKEEACAAGQRHRFRRKGIPEELRIVLKDIEDQPRANVSYRITVEGSEHEGVTGDDGLIVIPISPVDAEGTLELLEDGEVVEEYELELGNLDPPENPAGVQERLTNLGLYDGPVDGEMSSLTELAITKFQQQHDLEVTGQLDDATLQALDAAHES